MDQNFINFVCKKRSLMSSPENKEKQSLRSPEDQDILERSTKKTKRSEAMMDSEDMEGVESEIGLHHSRSDGSAVEYGDGACMEQEKTHASYKSMLTGREDGLKDSKEEEDMASDDEQQDKEREGDKDCPVITLTKKEKARQRRPWRQSLIIKIMGKTVGYAYLLRRLNIMWHPKARMDLITLENNYFLVKFGSIMDYEFAKYGGPWMIMDQLSRIGGQTLTH